jgi:hypothetical protein
VLKINIQMNFFFIKHCLVVVFFLFAGQLSSAQKLFYAEGSPDWLVDMFFVQTSFEDKDKYYSGEMVEETNQLTIGEELQGNALVEFNNLLNDGQQAVYSVQVTANEKVIDFYCYLHAEAKVWKISAIRRFLLPKFMYTAADSLSNLDILSQEDSSVYVMLKLMTSNDVKLKEYLNQNINNLNNLVVSFSSDDDEGIKDWLSFLKMNAVFRDQKYPGCIFIQIGAFETREVGFIYTEENFSLPPISPNNFIYLEKVLPNWYVYRII